MNKIILALEKECAELSRFITNLESKSKKRTRRIFEN